MIQDNAGDTPAHDATSVRAGLAAAFRKYTLQCMQQNEEC
jgi:hypothetical protein